MKSCLGCLKERPDERFRPTHNFCRECENAKSRAYKTARRKADPAYDQLVLAQKKASYQRNLDACREANRRYLASLGTDTRRERSQAKYLRRRDKQRLQQKIHYKQNRDRIIASVKAYASENRDKVREGKRRYFRANPELHAVHRQIRRARAKSRPRNWTLAQAKHALECWDNSCAVCSVPFGLIEQVNWDHWIPISNDSCPGTVPTNMIPLCSSCNSSKRAAAAEKWLRRCHPRNASRILARVHRYFATYSAATGSSSGFSTV